MNFDEYIEQVDKCSDNDVISRLKKQLAEWKQDDTNVIKRADSVEFFFSNSWIESEKIHNHLYRLWLHFKKEVITGIDGMTINERLYWFGLFDRFDSVQTEAAQKVICKSLCKYLTSLVICSLRLQGRSECAWAGVSITRGIE